MPKAKNNSKNSLEDMKLLFVIAYILLFVTGIVVYLIYGERDKRLRFHAVQAIFYGIAILILDFLIGIMAPFIGPFAGLLELVILILWLYGLYVGYRAMEGDDISIPIVGEPAHKYS